MRISGKSRKTSQAVSKIALEKKKMGTDFGNLLCLGDRARVIVPTEGKEVELFDSPNSGEEGIPRLSHKVAQMWSKRVIGRGDRHLKDVSSQTSTNVSDFLLQSF